MNTKFFSCRNLELGALALVISCFFACSADGVADNLIDQESIDEETKTSSSYKDDDNFYKTKKSSSSSYRKSSSSSYKSSSSSAASSSPEKAQSSSSKKPDASEGASEIKTTYDSEFDPSLAHDSVYDSRTSQYYKTVQIGAYVWIVENANNITTSSRCYNGKSKNCDIYGRLYYNSMQNICPSNFNVATVEAWENLFSNIGSVANIKSKGLWEESEKASAGKNSFGLSLLPGGICYGNDCFDLNEIAYYYGDGSPAMIYMIRYNSDKIVSKPITDFDEYKSMGVSVRCVQPATKLLKESDLPSTCASGDTITIVETGNRYICQSDKEWYIRVDKLPTSCTKKEEGKRYALSSSTYICHSEKVKTITALDREFGLCNIGDKAIKDSTTYVCKDGEWVTATIEEAYGKCVSKEATKIVQYRYSNYVCQDSSWRTSTPEELANGLCNSKNNGTVTTYANQSRICDNGKWRLATFDEAHGACNEATLWEEVTEGTTHYVCRNDTWDIFDLTERSIGVCNPSREGNVGKYNNYYYICKGTKWQEPEAEEILKNCTSAIADSICKFPKKSYVCDASIPAWREFTSVEYSNGLCTKANEGSKRTYGKEYLICRNHEWTKVDSLTYFFGACTSENEKKIVTRAKKDYVCSNNSWRTATINDFLGECTASNYRDTARYKDTLLICYNGWEKATFEKFYGSCNASRNNELQFNFINNRWEVCHGYWGLATMEDLFTCDKSHVGEIKEMPDSTKEKHYCREYYSNGQVTYYWSFLTECDLAIGPCTSRNVGETALYSGSYLTCTESKYNGDLLYNWKKASKAEALGACNSSNEGKIVKYATQNNICKGGKWTVEYGEVEGYKTVELAGKTWMAANIDGSRTGAYCYQGNGNNNGCANGGFYTYEDAQNACPTGWQLPDTSDFSKLIDTVNYYSGAALELQYDIYSVSNGAWQASSYNKGTNAYGFSLMGLGFCSASRNCSESMRETYLWTRTPSKTGAYAYHFTYNYIITAEEMPAGSYLGVRCVKK